MMEVNKDEAERCIEIALDAIKTGNVTRAEKFLNKAENLYPSQRAKGRHDENSSHYQISIINGILPFF